MKTNLMIFIIMLFQVSVASAFNCNCVDQDRGNANKNIISFDTATKEPCVSFGGKGHKNIITTEKIQGTGNCIIGNKKFPCNYQFEKVHPYTCTFNQ